MHGSAPDIAGLGIANPLAAVLRTALLARFVWVLGIVADRLETAVQQTLAAENYPQLTITRAIQQAVLDNLR